jgi:hypothetical protein
MRLPENAAGPVLHTKNNSVKTAKAQEIHMDNFLFWIDSCGVWLL